MEKEREEESPISIIIKSNPRTVDDIEFKPDRKSSDSLVKIPEKIKKIDSGILESIPEKKKSMQSPFKVRPKTPKTPDKRLIGYNEISSPRQRKSLTTMRQAKSTLRLEHEVMQQIQEERRWDHLHMSNMFN